ncbi:MAG TPA: metal ABC transporter permease [Herpetosiphonaceae bacterium]
MNGLLDPATYLQPLQYPFMQRGLLAVVLVSVLCALVGTFVVLRGLAFMGEAMRHALFAGVVISFLLGGSLIGGALIFALVVAWLIGVIGRQQGIGEDTAIGVFFSGSFALGIVLLNFAQSGVSDLATILLGNVLGISTFDLWLTVAVGVLAVLVVGLFYKELVLVSFDPALAAAQGHSLIIWDGILLVLLALALTTAFQTVGNLLVLALLLAPASTARLLTQRLSTMIFLAIGLAITAGVTGLYISYWRNLPPGPTIVLLSGVLFGLGLLFAPRTGVVQTFWQRRRLRHESRNPAA